MESRLLFVAVAIMLLQIMSCTDNIAPHTDGVVVNITEITAYADAGIPSKTGIIENGNGGKNVVWKAGNAISVFFNSGNGGGSKFSTVNSGLVASFSGTISAVVGDLTGTGGSAYYWATYPYGSSVSCDGSGIMTTLQDAQAAYANDISDDLAVTIGRSLSPSIYFRNTCTMIEFSLTQENITQITFSGNNNEYVAGEFYATLDDNNKVVSTPTSNAVKALTVFPTESSTFATGTNYYFVFLPGLFSNGYTIKFTRSDGFEATYTRSTSFDFAVGTMYTMANKDSGLTFTPIIISFADDKVKEICVTLGDKNGDGELSIPEASEVETFNSSFTNNTEIRVFDEIKYFTKVTSLEDRAFYGCSNLQRLIIPDCVESIGDEAFIGCNSLDYIKFGSGLSSIGDNIISPNHIQTLEVAEGNSKYDSRDACNALVESSTNTILYGGRNSSIPEGIVNIAAFAFNGSRLNNFTLPSTIQHIGEQSFSGYNELKQIICLAATPPILDFNSYFTSWHPFLTGWVMSYTTTISVPSAYYEAYQAAWGTYKDITLSVIEE